MRFEGEAGEVWIKKRIADSCSSVARRATAEQPQARGCIFDNVFSASS